MLWSIPRRGLLLLLLVGGLLAVGKSASAAGWLPAVTISSPGLAPVSGDIATDAAGAVTAIWAEQTFGTLDAPLMAATRPLGGSWSAPPVGILPSDQRVAVPRLAVDSAGSALAVWGHWDSFWGMVVRTARRPAGGAWESPVDLSLGEGSAFGHAVVTDGDGTATVIWSQADAWDGSEHWQGDELIRTRSRSADGTWSAPVKLTPADGWASRDPQLVVDDEGNVTAVWMLYDPDTENWVVQSARRSPAGVWDTASVDLSGHDEDAFGPELAVDGSGTVTAVWSARRDGDYLIRSSRRAADGTWSTPDELWNGGPLTATAAGGTPHSVFPQAALTADTAGNLTAVWGSTSNDQGGFVVRASRRAPGGTWSEPGRLAPADGNLDPYEGSHPLVQVDPAGNVMAVWEASVAGRDQAQAAYRPVQGPWASAVTLSDARVSAGNPRMTVDSRGYVSVLWRQDDDGYDVSTRTRVFDPVAPELRDVSVPVNGVVGVPVAMSADAFDVWSSVGRSWAFGDGGSAAGASVSHCYRTPGTRTVTVTGTDAAGNVATETRMITIVADPARKTDGDPCADPGPDPDPDPDPDPKPKPDPDPKPKPDPDPKPDPEPEPDPPIVVPRPKAPVVAGLRQASSRWRTRPVRGSRTPVGTSFRFRLDRASRVRLTFSRVTLGRRSGTRCVKATTANRARRSCRRYESRGTVVAAGRSGANRVAFRGKVRGRVLAPGRYRVEISASADGMTSAAAAKTFTIVR